METSIRRPRGPVPAFLHACLSGRPFSRARAEMAVSPLGHLAHVFPSGAPGRGPGRGHESHDGPAA